jgi:hypothetical protein
LIIIRSAKIRNKKEKKMNNLKIQFPNTLSSMSMGINSNLHVEFKDKGEPDFMHEAMGRDIYTVVSESENAGAGSFIKIDNKKDDLDPREGKVACSRDGFYTEVLYDTRTQKPQESYLKGYDKKVASGMESHVKWDKKGNIDSLVERRELPDHIEVLEIRHNNALGIISVDEKVLTYDEVDHPAT